MDTRLAALLDKDEIKETVLRYCRGIDRRDFDLVRSCYHPDASDHHGSFNGSVDEYINWVDKLTARYRFSMHLVGNVLIELGAAGESPRSDGVDPSDLAACETYGVSLHRSDDPRPFMNLATGFRYLDRFERRDGVWKIAARTAIGEWSLPVPSDAWWDIPEDHLASQRDPSDALYALLSSVGRAPTAPPEQ